MKLIILFLTATIFLSSCASTTLIQSTPPGATIYIDNQNKGVTPYNYSDTKIVGSITSITLKKDGYADLNVNLTRNERADVGAIVGGIFFLFPFLWVMEYDPSHNYELQPIDGQNPAPAAATAVKAQSDNSTNELIRLKGLLDQGAISNDDFTTLKVKILNNEYSYTNSASEQITKLKGLLDSGLLTKEEYDSQKNKIVDGK